MMIRKISQFISVLFQRQMLLSCLGPRKRRNLLGHLVQDLRDDAIRFVTAKSDLRQVIFVIAKRTKRIQKKLKTGKFEKLLFLPFGGIAISHEIPQNQSRSQANTFCNRSLGFLLECFANFNKNSSPNTRHLTMASFAMLNSMECRLMACMAADPAFWMLVGPFNRFGCASLGGATLG